MTALKLFSLKYDYSTDEIRKYRNIAASGVNSVAASLLFESK